MSFLRTARRYVADTLAEALDVTVLDYEPHGDTVGGTYVTVRIAGADVNDLELVVTVTDELRHDRTEQDRLDSLVDAVDLSMPGGTFLQEWRFDYDDTAGAIRATGTYRAARFGGWCDPSPPEL